MARVFDYTFTGFPNDTNMAVAYPEWVLPPADLITPNNRVQQNTIYAGRLGRPGGLSDMNPRVDVISSVVPGSTPNDYIVSLDFSMINLTWSFNYVGVIVRQAGSSGLLFRYRANVGYQLLTMEPGAFTLVANNTQDLEPGTVSFAAPLRRRMRVNCQGSSVKLFVDSFNNGTQQWTEGTTELINYTTTTARQVGTMGLNLASDTNSFDNPSNGFLVNRYSVDSIEQAGGAVPTVNSAAIAAGVTFSPFTYQITATETPTSYAASNLPPGLAVNTTTGLISGTPTTTGVYNVTLTASNSSGSSSNFALQITVIFDARLFAESHNFAFIHRGILLSKDGYIIPTI